MVGREHCGIAAIRGAAEYGTGTQRGLGRGESALEAGVGIIGARRGIDVEDHGRDRRRMGDPVVLHQGGVEEEHGGVGTPAAQQGRRRGRPVALVVGLEVHPQRVGGSGRRQPVGHGGESAVGGCERIIQVGTAIAVGDQVITAKALRRRLLRRRPAWSPGCRARRRRSVACCRTSLRETCPALAAGPPRPHRAADLRSRRRTCWRRHRPGDDVQVAVGLLVRRDQQCQVLRGTVADLSFEYRIPEGRQRVRTGHRSGGGHGHARGLHGAVGRHGDVAALRNSRSRTACRRRWNPGHRWWAAPSGLR